MLADRIARVREDVAACHELLDELLDVGSQRALAHPPAETCEACGWPVARSVPTCAQHGLDA